jgi:hypothetical protein
MFALVAELADALSRYLILMFAFGKHLRSSAIRA